MNMPKSFGITLSPMKAKRKFWLSSVELHLVKVRVTAKGISQAQTVVGMNEERMDGYVVPTTLHDDSLGKRFLTRVVNSPALNTARFTF